MLPFSPLSHAIAIGLLAWLFLQLRRVDPRPGSSRPAWIVAALAAWGGLSTWIAAEGLYLAHNDRLAIVLGIAAPYIVLGALSLSARNRELARRFALETPAPRLARVHVLRVLALGTIWKGWLGLLPAHFIVPVAIPDFAVGALALFMAHRMQVEPKHAQPAFVLWNLAGIAALLLAVPLMQLSQPGPLWLFADGPTTDEVLAFPMSIVPTLIAPLLIALHVAALVGMRTQASRSAIGLGTERSVRA